MDGEVNNRNARIAQDVKRDNTDEHRQTHETDNTRRTTRDGQHETRQTQEINTDETRQTQETNNTRRTDATDAGDRHTRDGQHDIDDKRGRG